MKKLILPIFLLISASIGSNQLMAQSIDLGTATDFAVLAGSGITNTGPTTIAGSVGSFPTTAQTGFSGELGGLTLPPGVYSSASSLGLTGVVRLNAAGDPNAVWVFQIGTTLITASNSSVLLINGTQACNVFWQVGSSATLGTGTRFAATIMASESITANTGATVLGRLLALNGAVTLNTNIIALAICKKLVTDSGASNNPRSSNRPSIEQLKNTLILAGQLVNVTTLPGLTSIYTQGFAQFDTRTSTCRMGR